MTDYSNKTQSSQRFLDDIERKRCCPKAGADDDSSTGNGCVDDWKLKLDAARLCSEKALACLQSVKDQHTTADSWESKLKKWKEDAEEAHKKAVATYNGLDSFLEAVYRTKSKQTLQATEAILCLVKSVFDRVSTLLFVSTSKEDDPGQIQALKQSIECAEDLDPGRKEKALSCIARFDEQMKLVQGMERDLLSKLLAIAHSAKEVAAAVDYAPDSDESEDREVIENLGIKWQLEDLKERISGGTVYAMRKRKCGEKQDPDEPDSDCCKKVNLEPPCGRHIFLPKEKFYFPICKMDDCGRDSEYYVAIAGLYDAAQRSTKCAKQGVDESTKLYQDKQAYYSGLKDAIKAIEDAKTA